MTILAILLFAALIIIAAIHLYWALGGFWPGHDEVSLARSVCRDDRYFGNAPGLVDYRCRDTDFFSRPVCRWLGFFSLPSPYQNF